MRVRVGTSGYAYKEWKGPFYPPDLPAAAMLRHYASRLATVEINNTFYRMPSEKLLAGWAEQVPATFTFALKAPRRITHDKRLRDAESEVGHLLEIAGVLGDRLGPILFQLPPFQKKDAALLRGFLEHVPPAARAAFEFRHASWFDDEVYEALRARGASLVVSDQDDASEPPVVATAPFGYLRLRRAGYDAAAVAGWKQRIMAQPWDEAYVYFKHEDAGTGPRLAAELVAELAGAGPQPNS